MPGSIPVRCVLLDLDGTLVDTAPDLAWSLNALRAEQALPPLPFATIRPHVSHGAGALIRAGFEFDVQDPRFEPLRQRLIEIYQENLARESRLFAGMDALLAALEARAIRWGVVTNKPASLTEPLLAALGLSARAACIVSGDTTARSKPHPEPLLHASRLVGTPPGECVYVGDARRDVEAGRSAGMKTLVALFGYLDDGDRPDDWSADGLVEHPLAILDWVAPPERDAATGHGC
jgi:N-acetyl-D-muramate 6-phosphate phosphatase